MREQTLNTVKFNKETPLFREGDRAECAYIIKSGSVRISKKGPSGRSIRIAKEGIGSIVGEMAIISDCPRTATVTAIEPVEAFKISKNMFEKRLKSVDPLLHSLLSTVISRLKNTSNQTVTLFEKMNLPAQPAKSIKPKQPSDSKNVSSVNMMLAIPNSQIRNGLRSGLFSYGFRDLHDTGDLHNISTELDEKLFDIMLLDISLGINNICQLVQKIRHGKIGNNPFITIVILTSDDDLEIQKSLRYAGCDEIIFKPISLAVVTAKIEELCNAERSFVVTRDYIGPNRSHFKKNNQEDAPFLIAPNTLAYKIKNNINDYKIKKIIGNSLLNLNDLKIERHIVQLHWILHRITPNEDILNLDYLLNKIDRILTDLAKRISSSQHKRDPQLITVMKNALLQYKNAEGKSSEDWNNIKNTLHKFQNI